MTNAKNFSILVGYSQLPPVSSVVTSPNEVTENYISSISLSGEYQNVWNNKLGVPYFLANQTRAVLAPLGHTTYLHCIVGNLGDRQVKYTWDFNHLTLVYY